MTHRSNHLTSYTLLIGFLLFSIGLNMVQYQRIVDLEQDKRSEKILTNYLYLKEYLLEKEIYSKGVL